MELFVELNSDQTGFRAMHGRPVCVFRRMDGEVARILVLANVDDSL